MTRNRVSSSRCRDDIRAWWAEHSAALRKSGQTQAAHCRAQGRDLKDVTLWKCELQATAAASAPRMAPVAVAPTTRQASFAIPETARESAVASQCSPVINTMSLPLESRICGLTRAGFDTDAPDRLRISLLWARSRRPVRLAGTRAIGAGGARRLGSGCRSTG